MNRHDLYKVNGLSAEAMFNNLKDLIDPNTEQQSESYVAFLGQEEVLEILKPDSGGSISSCNTTTLNTSSLLPLFRMKQLVSSGMSVLSLRTLNPMTNW